MVNIAKVVTKKKLKKNKPKFNEVVKTINEIVAKILVIMKRHIGTNKALSRRQLFTKVYKYEPEYFSDLQEFMMWELVKKAMHRCRQRTKCFIVSGIKKQSKYSAKDNSGLWYYWVAEDYDDYDTYRTNINKNIKAMKAMVKKCSKAVDKEWHKEDWLDDWNKKA